MIKFKMKKHHIEDGIQSDMNACPIALCLKQDGNAYSMAMNPVKEVSVCPHATYILIEENEDEPHDERWANSTGIERFVTDFDTGRDPKPITIIPLKKEYIDSLGSVFKILVTEDELDSYLAKTGEEWVEGVGWVSNEVNIFVGLEDQSEERE